MSREPGFKFLHFLFFCLILYQILGEATKLGGNRFKNKKLQAKTNWGGGGGKHPPSVLIGLRVRWNNPSEYLDKNVSSHARYCENRPLTVKRSSLTLLRPGFFYRLMVQRGSLGTPYDLRNR